MLNIIILIAGIGKRLRNSINYDSKPKCLIEVNNSKSILEMNLEKIISFGKVNNIYLVTGYKHKLIKAFLSMTFPFQKNIKTAYNPNFHNSVVYSVKEGLKNINTNLPVLLLNGDTCFDEDIFKHSIKLSEINHNSITLFGHLTDKYYNDDMLINVVNGKILNVGKNLKQVNGVSSGAILMSNDGLQKYLDVIHLKPVDKLKTHHGILQFIMDSGFDIDFVDLGSRNWLEIDVQSDIKRARSYFDAN